MTTMKAMKAVKGFIFGLLLFLAFAVSPVSVKAALEEETATTQATVEVVDFSDRLWEPIYTPSILPDSPFYFLKLWKEKLELALAQGAEKRVAKRVEILTRRLAELKAMGEKDPGSIEKHTLRYQNQLVLLEGDLANLGDEKNDWLREHVGEVTLKHQEVLLGVYENAPEAAKKGLENALENSLKGHFQAVGSLSEEKQEKLEEKVADKTERVIQKLEQVQQRVREEENEDKGEGEEALERVRMELQERLWLGTGETTPPQSVQVQSQVQNRKGNGGE